MSGDDHSSTAADVHYPPFSGQTIQLDLSSKHDRPRTCKLTKGEKWALKHAKKSRKKKTKDDDVSDSSRSREKSYLSPLTSSG